MHENQLTYPLAPHETMDYQYGFTNITTALAAERILFNSRTHFDAFFHHVPGFIKMMPDCRPFWAVNAIRRKAAVLYPGCPFPAQGTLPAVKSCRLCRVRLNHRQVEDPWTGARQN